MKYIILYKNTETGIISYVYQHSFITPIIYTLRSQRAQRFSPIVAFFIVNMLNNMEDDPNKLYGCVATQLSEPIE